MLMFAEGIEQFEDQLKDFKAHSNTAKVNDNIYSSDEEDIVNIGFGEKAKRDRLIVMDDVSGLADKSKKFASFLTVARKFNYTCVYIFHTFFVLLASVRKILEGVCNKKTIKYIPQSALWISRLFNELANRHDRVCLTLDCSGVNIDSPGRFRAEAEKLDFQICYFNVANNEQVYNNFVSNK